MERIRTVSIRQTEKGVVVYFTARREDGSIVKNRLMAVYKDMAAAAYALSCYVDESNR